jgi:hypothetical protein
MRLLSVKVFAEDFLLIGAILNYGVFLFSKIGVGYKWRYELDAA